MATEPRDANSRRFERLAKKLADPKYRHSYAATQTRHFLARQIRELRGDMSQAEFGKKLGMKQNVISRLENPAYGRWTLSTLFEVAKALDIALHVRFVDFPTFVRSTEDQSVEAASPASYDRKPLAGLQEGVGDYQDGNLSNLGDRRKTKVSTDKGVEASYGLWETGDRPLLMVVGS